MIIAVDPGKVTGLATLTTPALEHHARELSPMEAVAHVEWHIRREYRLVLAVESFHMSAARHTQQPDALEVIGALKYLTRIHEPRVELRMQTPVSRKAITRGMLVDLNWDTPTTGGHANDASRHLLLQAIRLKYVDLEDLV